MGVRSADDLRQSFLHSVLNETVKLFRIYTIGHVGHTRESIASTSAWTTPSLLASDGRLVQAMTGGLAG